MIAFAVYWLMNLDESLAKRGRDSWRRFEQGVMIILIILGLVVILQSIASSKG